ncbi:MAG: glycosyltransferase family 4 protein [Planctomycetes bacterium]|nr:glycosyltransferase family 4 protein [Planctomycetota bacterium]
MERADVVLPGAETDRMMPHPLRVLIDARMLIGRFSGVSRFVTRLVDELARRDDLRVVVLCSREVPPAWTDRKDIEILPSDFGRSHRTAARRLRWEEMKLRGYIRSAQVDVVHATWNTGVPPRCPVPSVLTIHDLIPWHRPKHYFTTSWQRWCYSYAVRASARRARCITTVSQYVRRDVLNTLRVQPDRVVTVPNGVNLPENSEFKKMDSESVAPCWPSTLEPSPFVLYVGGHEQRKNVAGVFRALRRYEERYDTSPTLRLTGTVGALCPAAACEYERMNPERVQFLGEPDDHALGKLYASAGLLLMTSYDEGFGLPVLEAMAHGCPVVAASRAALPEVVGDAGLLVDPDDPDAVTHAMHRVLTDSVLRRRLIARGLTRAQSFTWGAVADRMINLYHRVLHESSQTPASGRLSPLPWRIPTCKNES